MLVADGHLIVVAGDRRIDGAALTGATLAAGALKLRIVQAPAADAAVPLYEVLVDSGAGEAPPCGGAPPLDRQVLFLAPAVVAQVTVGAEEQAGGTADFALICAAGAIGKCVRWGYAPWRPAPDLAGPALLRSCVHMVRADYCGDGRSFTRNGTSVDIFDRYGRNTPDRPQGFTFEAAWGPQGATCVRHTRWPDLLATDAIEASCPRLRGHVGPNCDPSVLGPQAPLGNSSSPTPTPP